MVSGGSARETQILFFTEAEAREWATTGKKAAAAGGPAPVQLHKPAAEALLGTRPTSTGVLPPVLESPASGDRTADAGSLVPAPAAAPGELAANATATPPATPAPARVDGDQAVDLREAADHHLPGITLAALRFARADDPAFPASAGKRGAELLYRVGDLKKWARNRARAAIGTTALDWPSSAGGPDFRPAGRRSGPVRFRRHDPRPWKQPARQAPHRTRTPRDEEDRAPDDAELLRPPGLREQIEARPE
ncbi:MULTISPECIES: hypothetical protein [Streptomyces]|uniref:hypothetical protein n=2 Tax=Streptomyces TaxID=1883 RepID=UPI0002ABB3E2